MTVLAQFWEYLMGMVRDTARVFWRLLPLLIATYALGWLGSEIAINLAAKAADVNAWFALGVLSLGFVAILSATIACLRLVGDELGVRADLPDGAVEDDRDASFANLLAITLLPFLGIYAVFDHIQDAARRLELQVFFERGVFAETVAAQLNPFRSKRAMIIAACVVVGAYLVRRAFDLLHEKTDIRPLGLAAAFMEGFFMLSLLLSGGQLLRHIQLWWRDREFNAWGHTFVQGLDNVFSLIKIDLPDVLVWLGHFFTETLWPTLTAALFEPVLWLAVAALIYGSNVLSIAEIWRKGETLESKLPGSATSRATRHIESEKKTAGRGRRAWLEFQEVFVSDVDDKYLPTIQSVRLMLRAGLTFMSAYLVLYAIVTLAQRWIDRTLTNVVGGRPATDWVAINPGFSVVINTVAEPIRLCLLAVAFHTALRAFKARAEQPVPAQPAPAAPEPAGFPAPVGLPRRAEA